MSLNGAGHTSNHAQAPSRHVRSLFSWQSLISTAFFQRYWFRLFINVIILLLGMYLNGIQLLFYFLVQRTSIVQSLSRETYTPYMYFTDSRRGHQAATTSSHRPHSPSSSSATYFQHREHLLPFGGSTCTTPCTPSTANSLE